MSKIISISNHKGGVGKTTSTLNIGAALNKLGKKVLLIDLDPQANLSQSLGVVEPALTIYHALKGEESLYNMAPVNIAKGLDLIPSSLDLSGAEIELVGEMAREYILRGQLEPLKTKYDYILIDCPPSLGLLTINALTASDAILIPLQAHYLALQGLAKLTQIIEKISKGLNKGLILGGVFITQFDSRKILNRDVASTIEEHLKEKVFKTKIRENIALAEAPSQGLDVFRYAPKSKGAEDYLKLAKEIIKIKY